MPMEQEQALRKGVRNAYTAAAERPTEEHPFPVGLEFAESLGYPSELLGRLPPAAVEAFVGVSNLSVAVDMRAGATVLDLGCGSGLDALVAASRLGRDGKVIGVDFSRAMLTRAQAASREMGSTNVAFLHADAERLPLPDGQIDLALVNGIFNLNPARSAIFAELGRVVREGGMVYAAELILKAPLQELIEPSADNWFS